MNDPNASSEPTPSTPSPAGNSDISHMGETLVGQAVRDSVRRGVPAQQILDEYKQRGPQARADAAAGAPQVFGPMTRPKKLGFWARLFGRKS
jgi:hypothetical protein